MYGPLGIYIQNAGPLLICRLLYVDWDKRDGFLRRKGFLRLGKLEKQLVGVDTEAFGMNDKGDSGRLQKNR
jgi:hypothetical protein